MRQQILKHFVKSCHHSKEKLLALLYLFKLEHFSPLVKPAGLTEVMSKFRLMTLGTLRKCRKH